MAILSYYNLESGNFFNINCNIEFESLAVNFTAYYINLFAL